MTWYYWILIRRNLDQFDFFTLRIMKLLEWKLVRLSTSWSGSGATSHAGLCRRWRPGRVAGHSPRSGPGSAGGSRPWTPAGSTPTRLFRHNMYLQSVIVKWQYFTFESKLPVNLFPPETWCHWIWAGILWGGVLLVNHLQHARGWVYPCPPRREWRGTAGCWLLG